MATVTILNLPATNTVDATTVAPVVFSGTTHKATLTTLGAFINTNAATLSASGNVTGGNLITTAAVSAASMSASGNITGGNLITSAAVSAASVSASGNITGGNILGGANVNATTHTGTTVSVSGNITGGNLITSAAVLAASVSASGNVTGGNILGGANVNATTHTGTTVSVSGNITGGNLVTSAAISAASVSASGNITGGNLNAAGLSLSSNVVSALNVTDAIAGANLTTPGLISATGNITGGNVNVGNITIATDLISSANATITIDPATIGSAGLVVINGNLQVNGTTTTINSNVVSTNDLTVNYANNAINAAAANGGGIEIGPIGSPFITWLYNNSANVFTSSGGISAVGNVTGGNLTVSTGTITVGNIVNANGNLVGNIGSSSLFFNTVFAKATSAQYADLAEKYTADAEYTSGTVLSFGGAQEVTITLTDADRRVAGVVSTNPATIMNAGLTGEHVATVALTGRVPCSVTGTVRKGDSMVSAGNGQARAEANPAVSTVIGKSLEDFDGESGMIEIVVGRV
jgi:hypothetical protein